MPNSVATETTFNPNLLLDGVIKILSLKNDAALERLLGTAPPVLSKIRHQRLAVGASMLIRMHEVTDLSILELRAMMGDRRERRSYNAESLKKAPVSDRKTSAGVSDSPTRLLD